VTTAAPVRSFLQLVAIEHSVFALPFAYLSALTAMELHDDGFDLTTLVLITGAMAAARSWARSFPQRSSALAVSCRTRSRRRASSDSGVIAVLAGLFVGYSLQQRASTS